MDIAAFSQEICALPGSSGSEGAYADYIEETVRPYVDQIDRDVMGNLICIERAAEGARRVMLTTCMDEIGFIVTAIEERGSNIGGVNPKVTTASRVQMKSGAQGVLFTEAGSPNEALFIDIGASTKEEAEQKAQVGDWAVVRGVVSDMGDKIAASYLDDRSGCAVLIETLRRLKDNKGEIIDVFTTQEEVGLRGALAAGYAVTPDMAIEGDCPRSNESNRYVVSHLGKGTTVKIMDRGIIAHPAAVREMEEAAARAGMQVQREVLTGGATDVGAIHTTRAGVPSGTLSIPCRYVHAPCETVNLNDMEGAVRLLEEMFRG